MCKLQLVLMNVMSLWKVWEAAKELIRYASEDEIEKKSHLS
jgi:hypothetical protein